MTRRLFSLIAGLAFGLSAASLPAQAATDQEALKCGLAIAKLQAKQLSLISKATVKLCKDPGEISNVAAKIAATLNKAIGRLNAKFNADNCDPDIDQVGGLPFPPTTQELVEGQLGGVDTPLGDLCNNIDDNP